MLKREKQHFLQLILDRDLKAVSALIHVCRNRWPKLAWSLLQIFHQEGTEAHLMRTIVEQEIDAEQGSKILR